MENERRKLLIESMKKINKKSKDSLIDFAENTDNLEKIYSGLSSIDKFTGGFQKGNFTIAWGGESVGKSTLVLQTIANCQKEGKIACYLDMERSFDSTRAKQLGVNLEELVLVSKCQTAEDALEIIRTFAKDKVVDLIVLDSIQSMSPKGEQENKGKERELASQEMAQLARTLSKFFRVVAPDIYRAKIACILIGQVRLSLGSFIVRAELSGGLALRHFAYQSIFMRRGQKSDAPVQKFKNYFLDPDGQLRFQTISEEVGFDTVLKLYKTKSSDSAKEGSEIHLPFLYDKGFVDNYDSNADIQIRIDPEAPEPEQEKIQEMMIEKGIIQEEKFVEDHLKEKSPEFQEKVQKETEKLRDKIEQTKKKRGRPPKNKEK